MIKIVIFARVSTNIQDYDRQVNELTFIASSRGWSVEAVFAEKISGAKKNADRVELKNMIEYILNQKIDKVMVTELSRIGRDTLQVLEVIENLNSKGISLFIANYNIETLTADKKVNPMSQFLVTILAEVARMERKTIKERMDSGYNNYRSNGGKVGRKVGYKKSVAEMLEQYAEEVKYIKKGIALRTISKLTGTSVNTISKCKALLQK